MPAIGSLAFMALDLVPNDRAWVVSCRTDPKGLAGSVRLTVQMIAGGDEAQIQGAAAQSVSPVQLLA